MKYRLESSHPLEEVERELEKLAGEVEMWGDTARGVDLLLEQSGTQLGGTSARSTVHEIANKLQSLRYKPLTYCCYCAQQTFLATTELVNLNKINWNLKLFNCKIFCV